MPSLVLHLNAPLAEKARRLIADRMKAAFQAEKPAGARKSNEFGIAGAAWSHFQARLADEFASAVLPIIEAVRKSGASLADIAHAHAREIRSATGARVLPPKLGLLSREKLPRRGPYGRS